MGKHRSPEELLALAQRMVKKFTALKERNEGHAKRHRERHDFDKSTSSTKAAERNESHVRKWAKEVRRLTKAIQVRDLMQRRAPESGRVEERILSPAEQRQRDKDVKAHRGREEQRRKQLSAADVEYDPRTAMGRRTYDIVNFGAKMRAANNHFNACIRRPADRTDIRLLAWQQFDSHYHAVSAGLMASPRYEPGVDTSTVPEVSTTRLAALQSDSYLRAELGVHLHNILVEVVYHQRHPRDLPGLSALEAKDRTVLLLHALDLAAIYWRLDEVRKVRTRHSSVVIFPPTGD